MIRAVFLSILLSLSTSLCAQLDIKVSENNNFVVHPKYDKKQNILSFDIYSINKGRLIRKLKTPISSKRKVVSYKVSPEARFLSVLTRSKLYVFDVRTGLLVLEKHNLNQTCFSENSDHFFIHNLVTGALHIYASGDELGNSIKFTDRKGVKDIEFDLSTQTFIIQGNSGAIYFYDLVKDKVVKKIRADDHILHSLSKELYTISARRSVTYQHYKLPNFTRTDNIKVANEITSYVIANNLITESRIKVKIEHYAIDPAGENMAIVATVNRVHELLFILNFEKNEIIQHAEITLKHSVKSIQWSDSKTLVAQESGPAQWSNSIIYTYEKGLFTSVNGNSLFSNYKEKDLSDKKQSRINIQSESGLYSFIYQDGFLKKKINAIKQNTLPEYQYHFPGIKPESFGYNDELLVVSKGDSIGYFILKENFQKVYYFEYDLSKQDDAPPLEISIDSLFIPIVTVKEISSISDSANIFPVFKAIALEDSTVNIQFHLADSTGTYYLGAGNKDQEKVWCKAFLVDDQDSLHSIVGLKISENSLKDTLPINVALVSDYSGSMGSKNISMLENGVLNFIQNKLNSDNISIIKYDDGIKTDAAGEVDLKKLIESAAETKYKKMGGATAMLDALMESFSQLNKVTSNSNKISIVITDGYENSSMSTKNDVIKKALKTGTKIFTIGVGPFVDSELLETLALNTGGSFYHIMDPSALSWIYSDIKRRINTFYTIKFDRPLKSNRKFTLYLKACNPKCDSCSTEYLETTWNNAHEKPKLKKIKSNDESAFSLYGTKKIGKHTEEEMTSIEQIATAIPVTDLSTAFEHQETVDIVSEINEIDLDSLDDVFDNVHLPKFEFITNSDSLTQDYSNQIDSIVYFLKQNMSVALKITGHTDSDGEEAFNHELSVKRAHKVKEILIRKGISQERLVCQGKGEKKPLVPNNSDEHKAINRRIEFALIQQ